MTDAPNTRPPRDPLSSRALSEALTYRLARLHAKVTGLAARLLERSAGITLLQWRVFYLIDALGPITAAEM